MKPLTREELKNKLMGINYFDRQLDLIEANERAKCEAEIREKSKLTDAQMKEISRLQVLASKQEAEIHAKEMLICSLTRGKREQDAEIVEDKIIIKEWMADNQRLTEELVKLKDVISKGTDMKVELLKENAQLKELVKEAIPTVEYANDIIEGCNFKGNWAKKWLAKAKQALGED